MKPFTQIPSLLFAFFLLMSMSVSAQVNPTTIRPKIIRLVDKLGAENLVHFGYPVGSAGKPETQNKYYKLYLKLRSKATDEELVALTKGSSVPIVVYSFSILHSRGYKDLKNIFIDHLGDTTFYWTASGCVGLLERVNWFMLRRLNPASRNAHTTWLTKEEYDSYCMNFKKQDGLFWCN